jgi:2-oxoglutarate dehydrogenase E1 component
LQSQRIISLQPASGLPVPGVVSGCCFTPPTALLRNTGFKSPRELAQEILPHLPTAVEESQLKSIANVIGSVPEGFNVHKNLSRILANRKKSVEEGNAIDWSTAEALAFGSLLLEGKHVRVSGQDVERGTFSQRHAVLHDQESEDTYTPLQHLGENQAKFVISNSSLSEFGV